MNVLAEETTTLPEGAVITVYRGQYTGDRLKSKFTQLVAYHAEHRVEMRMDDVGAHCLKTYLRLVVREIERRRMAMHAPPQWVSAPSAPKTMKDFVDTMAYYGMFIFETLNETTNSEAILQGSEQVQGEIQKRPDDRNKRRKVRGDGDGTKRGSGKAKANRRRRKQRDERVQSDAVRPAQKPEAGGHATGLPSVVDEDKPGSGRDSAGNPARELREQGDSSEETPLVGLPEDCPF